jgi:hypothetical protein
MQRLATFSLCVISMMAGGCAGAWRSRSATQATIYAETTEIPVLWADSTFVDSVDGVAIKKGKGYVLVDPGPRTLTIFHVDCPLPTIAVFCLHSAGRRQVQSDVTAGAAYRIGWDNLILVTPNGQPAEMPSNTSLERTRGR